MKASKELTRYLSSKVWNVSAEGFRVILESFNGNPFESIHVQLPTQSYLRADTNKDHIIETLQDCVNDLDERLKKLEPQQDINEAPTLKRNLSLDNTEQEYLTPQEQLKHNQWRQRN